MRMIRWVFNYDLGKAKEVKIIAEKQGNSIEEYQSKLISDIIDSSQEQEEIQNL